VASLGGTLGPLIGGALAARLGYRWPFVIVGVMLVGISGLASLRVVEPKRWPLPTAEEEIAETEADERVEAVVR
jgi:MFS family permease